MLGFIFAVNFIRTTPQGQLAPHTERPAVEFRLQIFGNNGENIGQDQVTLSTMDSHFGNAYEHRFPAKRTELTILIKVIHCDE